MRRVALSCFNRATVSNDVNGFAKCFKIACQLLSKPCSKHPGIYFCCVEIVQNLIYNLEIVC